jgi:hypothetical protein
MTSGLFRSPRELESPGKSVVRRTPSLGESSRDLLPNWVPYHQSFVEIADDLGGRGRDTFVRIKALNVVGGLTGFHPLAP